LPALDVERVFADILERAKSLDPANARKWFDELTVLYFDAGSIGIGCPNDATVRFLAGNCRASFTRAAQQITGHLVTVEFLPDNNKKTGSDLSRQSLQVHPDYTFENFVVGPCNRLAHASCIAVSQSLGNTYNPLFLYGNSGAARGLLRGSATVRGRRYSASKL
jgi:chromosomal replication initiator protein